MQFGWNALSVEVRDQLADSPQIRENIGEIEKFEVNLLRSGAHEDEDVFVYDIKGSKAEGQVKVMHITDDAGDEQVIWAELNMDDGRQIMLDVDGQLP